MADLPNNPVPLENYPSASQDGQAIPLAAVRPIGSYYNNLPAGTATTVELPEDINLVSFFSSSKGTIILPGAEIAGAYQSQSFIFLPNVSYDLVLPRNIQIFILGEEGDEGEVIINLLMKWGQMRNIGSYYVS